LQWTDVANENGYRLERRTGTGGSWSEIASTAANVVTFANENLSPSTEYFYRVRAFNDAGASAYSAEVRAVTHSAPQPQPPGAPTLQASVASSTRVNLQWTDVANENGYRLERKTGASGSWAEVISTAANVVTFSNENLSASTEYFYRVRAFNDAGNSPFSAEVRAVTHAPPQPQATAQFVEIDSITSGDWPGKFGANGYMIAARASNLDASYRASLSGKQDFLWQASATETRAPLVAADSSQRVASAWYGDVVALSIDAGATARRVALYVLDWDNLSRVQRVVVRDEASGATLDAREVSDFGNGKYLVYDIRGSVRISLEKLSGPNALLSGVFVGGAAVAPISDKPLTLTLRPSAAGQLTLRVAGDSGQRFRIESSPDFRNWTQLVTGALVTSTSEIPVPVSRGPVFLRAVNTP
jgi:hypothetical protein